MDKMVYGYKKGFVTKEEYSIMRQNIEMVIYSLIGFFAPFLIGHPQALVGVLVNAGLFASARNLTWQRTLPIIFLPSLGVLSKGLIFGPLTPYLIFMIPAIWAGNAILVFLFRFVTKKMNEWPSMIIASAVKSAFLFGIAYVFVMSGFLPTMFLTTMGIFQLGTAIIGGILALTGTLIVDKFMLNKA